MNSPPPNPWVTKFFNLTAGLEKFIVAVLAALIVYVNTIPDSQMDPSTKILITSILAAVQMLYTTNGAPVPPTTQTMLTRDAISPETLAQLQGTTLSQRNPRRVDISPEQGALPL